MDLSFDRTVAPGLLKSREERGFIAVEVLCKTGQGARGGALAPQRPRRGISLSNHPAKFTRRRGDGGDLRRSPAIADRVLQDRAAHLPVLSAAARQFAAQTCGARQGQIAFSPSAHRIDQFYVTSVCIFPCSQPLQPISPGGIVPLSWLAAGLGNSGPSVRPKRGVFAGDVRDHDRLRHTWPLPREVCRPSAFDRRFSKAKSKITEGKNELRLSFSRWHLLTAIGGEKCLVNLENLDSSKLSTLCGETSKLPCFAQLKPIPNGRTGVWGNTPA